MIFKLIESLRNFLIKFQDRIGDIFNRECNLLIEFFLKFLKYVKFLEFFSKIFDFKINRRIICFGSMMGQEFIDNTKYLFLYLNQKKKYNCYWFTSSKSLYKKLKEKGFQVIYNYSFEAIRILRSAGYIITAWGLMGDFLPISFSQKSIIVQTWHGNQFKKIGADIDSPYKEVNEYNNYYIISPSKHVNRFLESAFQINPRKIIVTGFPRNDILFKADENFKKFLKKKYHISEKFEKIIFYAPTFREHELTARFPILKEDFEELNKYLQKNNILLINKSHFWNKEILFRSIENIIVINKFVDTQELIIISDMLITDYSTIFFDFVLMKKPVILFPYDLEEYLRYPGIYHSLEDIAVGPIAKNGKELIEALKTETNWLPLLENKIKKIQRKFWDFHDGDSCKRFFENIILKL